MPIFSRESVRLKYLPIFFLEKLRSVGYLTYLVQIRNVGKRLTHCDVYYSDLPVSQL